MRKRALVVDDSRSARAFLGRLLEQHGLQVDMATTAEEALEYLGQQRPDVIFMDHLMPGMDGLQAVRLIKADARTATIPILMYTSQEGELYLSQARALGALGVLPKETHPGDVARALHQLNLLPERREPVLGDLPEEPVGPPPAALVTDVSPSPDLTQERRRLAAEGGSGRAGLPELPPEIAAALEAMLREHSIELRRYVGDHLTQHADRIVGDVRIMLRDGDAGSGRHERGQRPRGLWLTLAVLALAGVAAVLLYQSLGEQRALDARLRAAQAQLASTRQQLDELAAAANAAPAPQPAPAAAPAAQASTSRILVPFGETPLAGARIAWVRASLERWHGEGRHGMALISGYAGRYCLASAAGEQPQLAEASTPVSQCAQIATAWQGSPVAQSVEFANMLDAFRAEAGGQIDVQLAPGEAAALVPYPPVTDILTAGDWNRIAAENNRIELHWQAQP